MLRLLRVANLAIIDEVEVEFHEGFNVLTGETGAGKSILIGALNLLLGARASADVIRTGEEEAQVDAVFEATEGMRFSQDFDGLSVPAGEVLLSRRIFRSGRSRCAINGSLVTLAALQAAGRGLVSIFGQREHYVLLNPEEHIEVLDGFGALDSLRGQTGEAFRTWTGSMRKLEKAREKLAEMERLAGENAAAVEELTEVGLKEGEEDDLAEEREILKRAVQIREKAYEAHQALYSRSGSVLGDLSEVKRTIDQLVSSNPRLGSIKENFEEALYRLEDVALELRDLAEKAHSDPARLEQIEDRLALIRKLKKKYAKDLDGLIRHLDALGRDAGDVLDARAEARKIETETARQWDGYVEVAVALSEARREAAGRLETSVEKELKDLAMPSARFSVKFDDLGQDKGSANGLERLEFLMATNPGEALRPLAAIASGGELSRIMLAVKALQADVSGAGTVIFDEVDAGIGGHTASAVGMRLARVARRQQVLCVTHLHQIAALADHHLTVQKSVKKGRTRIEVTRLGREQRVEELARMLGAGPGSKSALDHVRSLMDTSIAEVPS